MQSFIQRVSDAAGDSLWAAALDAFLKSTVVLIVAVLIALLLRRSSAAVRHRMWCLAFAGLLLLPVLSYALPAWRIAILPPVEPMSEAAVDAEPVAATPTQDSEPTVIAGEFPADLLLDAPTDHAGDGMPPLAFEGRAFDQLAAHVTGTENHVATTEPADELQVAEAPVVSLRAVIAFGWLSGVVLVLTPLVAGLLHSVFVGLRADRITNAQWTGLLDELCGRLQLKRRVTLLELKQPVIPMTWGVLRPVVVVPQAAQCWPERLRRFVLLHELAHVKRWDVPLQLLGRVACAVYWFHPLAWYALRRLRIERELACDDYVVTTGERPSDYAEQLLQIVRTCRPAGLASVGVAMARTSHLEGRIRAMFDKARSHVPLSARAARVLSLAAALLVTTVAVVRPAAREAKPIEPVAANDEAAESDQARASQEAETVAVVGAEVAEALPKALCHFRGIVRDEAGKPVAGAKLEVPDPSSFGSVDDVQNMTLATTGDDGRFDAQYEPDEFYGTAGQMLSVTAAGFGPEWLKVDEARLAETLEIGLRADTVPIEGQILDLEGNPVAGAQISVYTMRIPGEGGLDQFLESVKTDGGSNFQFATNLFEPKLVAPVTTDQQGRFRITGIGRERVVDLELHGQGLHQARFRVMTRTGENVSPLDREESARGQKLGQTPVHGATFSYLAQPARLINGIVVDAESKAPLSGISIGTLESGAHATTGDDGRFVLDGCVKADEYRLLANAPAGVPYLQASQRVVDEAGLEPIEITFEMTRGVTVSGTVTDNSTSRPVPATVTYWPAYPNPYLRRGTGGMEANAVGAYSNAETNREGQFMLPVLPGPGFLCISANDRESYESANVDAAAFFRERDMQYFSLVETSSLSEPVLITAHSDATSGAMPQSQFQAIELLNIDAAAVQEPRGIRLKPKDAEDTNAATENTAATTVAQATSLQSATKVDALPKIITVRGIVLDLAGQPTAGATIRVQTPLWAMLTPLFPPDWKPPVIETKSDAQGKFEISFSTQSYGDLTRLNPQWAEIWKKTAIAASSPGFGPAWIVYDEIKQPDQPVTLKLVEDLPIEGRIVDLEGAPLAGETIKISGPRASAGEDLSDWLAAIKAGEPPWTSHKQAPRSVDPQLVGIPETVTSDADGRFEIHGVGRERHLTLILNSESVAYSQVMAATRVMEPVRAVQSSGESSAVEPVFGARFTLAATPARIVTGTVRDAETGVPLAGVKVESHILASRLRLVQRVVETVTDSDGRFRLAGMPKGDGNEILLVPNDDQPFFMRTFAVPNPDGLAPVDVTVDLHRGIWITGRVTDATTGEPQHARLHYLPYRTNTFAQALPEFDDNGNVQGDQMRYQTKADGTFRLVGLAGPAVLGAESVLKDYPMGQGYAQVPGPRHENSDWVLTYHNPINPSPKWPTAMAYIDPPADAETINVDFKFDAGSRVAIRLVDPDGQLLPGVEVTGRQPRYGGAQMMDGAEFEAISFGTDEERTLVFEHKARGLGWAQRVKPGDSAGGPMVIKLQSVARVTGRLLTTDGDAITGMAIQAWPLPSGDFARTLESVPTDSAGRFTYTLLPGAKYYLRGEALNVPVVEVAKELAIEPGQLVDLGDVRIDADGKVMGKPAAEAEMPARPLAVASATSAAKTDDSAARDSEHSGSYSGQVIDDVGKPLAGATVWLALTVGEGHEGKLLREVATSGMDGRFQFTFDPELRKAIDKARSHWDSSVVAVAPGHGLGWFPVQVFADDPESDWRPKELRARLIKAFGEERIAARSLVLQPADRPVRGRLVDLEGRPRANVTVHVDLVRQPDISLLLQAFQEKSKDRYWEAINATGPAWGIDRQPLQQLLPAVTTDADGRFELNGIGTDQLVTLTFAGAGVEAQVIYVLGRSMEPARIPHLDSYPNGSKDVFYGWEFNHVVGSSVPVEGVVKEFDSGVPVPNTLVRVERLFGEGGGSDEGQLRLDTDHLRTMTDAQGRFRIDGMPPGKGHVLMVEPSKAEPLLLMQKSISLSATDAAAAEVEIQVKRVFWIEGQISDKQTGEPVTAYVDYLPLRKNPNTLDKLGLQDAFKFHRYQTDKEGRYRVPGLPGPGVIHVRAINDRGYPLSVGAETIDGYDAKRPDSLPTTHGYPLSNWNLVRQIEPAADATSFTCDVELDAGQSVAGTVVRSDGTPVSSFSALGEIEKDPFWKLIADGRFTVQAYDGVGPRQLFFKTSDESLVGRLQLEGPATQDMVVTLEPAVRVTGRLIAQETDLPADRYSLYCESSSQGSFRIDDCNTGDDGRFEINGLTAGVTYEIHTANSMRFSSGKNNFTLDLLQAKPGDVVELGDVRGKTKEKMPAKPAAMMKPPAAKTESAAVTTKPANASDAPHSITVRGQVVDSNDQPVGGAFVAATAVNIQKSYRTNGNELLGETTTDDQGRFEFHVAGVSSTTYQSQRVFARTDDSAVAWAEFDLDAGTENITLRLQPQRLLEGQMVDVDGQPAPGVVVHVQSVMIPPMSENFATGLSTYAAAKAAVQPFTTDADGRFAIRNVAAGHGVYLKIVGDDRFAPQDLLLNTGADEARGEFDATYRAYARNLKPGEQFTIPLSPAQLFEGVVLLGDTDQLAANARINIWASQQEFGSMTTVESQTDANGRFKLNPNPGIRFGIQAYAPDGVPYLVKQLRDLRWTSGDASQTLKIRLPQGALVRGTVVDAITGGPLRNAAVQYYADEVHNTNFNDDLITRWQGAQRTNEAGEFQIAVPAGPGRLLVHADSPHYVLEERGILELISGRAGGNRVYAHAFAKIDPAAGESSAPLEIKLTPGGTVTGHLVDSEGKPVAAAKMISRLKIVWHSPEWRGFADDVVNGRFEISGLREGVEYPVCFVDVERGLGATATISTANPNPTIVLEPCGTAKARYVDQDKQPVTNLMMGVNIVVTPGVSKDDGKAQRLGQLAADEDFYANVTSRHGGDRLNANGEVTYDLLIPGATYRIWHTVADGTSSGTTDFSVKPGESRDLGTIVQPGDR